MIDNYDYEEREDDSVLKVLKDEEKVVEMDIEIKPKPPSAEDELLLDTAQILIMVGSAFISFGVVMLAFFLCRQRLESQRKEKAMPYTIPATRSIAASTSPIVKNYQRVPTSTQQLLASPAHIEMYREEKAGSPLLP
jgi:cytochrome bd-type quinol oxidase subunit 1